MSSNQHKARGRVHILVMGALLAALPFAVVADGVFTPTGSMTTPRYYHTATPLADGRVLVAGGDNGTGLFAASAEVYDPLAGAFTAVGDMTTPRAYHAAARLVDGKVLIAGGDTVSGASAEVYDPVTGMFTPVGDMTIPRGLHTATPLPDGKVLIAGGDQTAEVYDPVTHTFAPVGDMTTARSLHTATPLVNGMVLAAGGSGEEDDLASAEIYDPATGTFNAVGSMATPRWFQHTATTLVDGTVLVAGGHDGVNALTSAEIYEASGGDDDAETLIAELAAFIGELDVTHGQQKSASRRLEKLLKALDADKKNSMKKGLPRAGSTPQTGLREGLHEEPHARRRGGAGGPHRRDPGGHRLLAACPGSHTSDGSRRIAGATRMPSGVS